MKLGLLQLIALGFLVSVAFAETPDEVTHKIIREIRGARSMAPAADYIDWAGAFESLAPEEREAMGVQDVEAYKAHELKVFNESVNEAKASIQEALKNVEDEKQKEVLKRTAEHLNETIEEQQKAAMKSFSETSFEVFGTKIDGESAIVEMTVERAGQDKKVSAELVMKDGKWLIKSAAPFNPIEANNAVPTIFGAPPVSVDGALNRPY